MMKINPIVTKALQRIWNKQTDNKPLNLTDDEAECLAQTLIKWKTYSTLNQKG